MIDVFVAITNIFFLFRFITFFFWCVYDASDTYLSSLTHWTLYDKSENPELIIRPGIYLQATNLITMRMRM